MRILLTGGAGYLGSILVPMLLSENHELTVLDNFMYNQTPLLEVCHNPKFTIIRGDTRDEKLITNSLKHCDAIIPLACLTGAPLCEKYPNEARAIIVDAVKMICVKRSPDQIIIYPTTNSGYGVGQEGSYCTEQTPLRPVSLYGRLKVEAERLILESGNAITLRLATSFGISPRMRLDLLVNDFVYRAVNDKFLALFEGNFKRNYVHVRDAARAFIHSLKNFEEMKNQAYNVGLSDANLSKLELCQEIKKQVPDFYFVESQIGEDPDKRNYIVSNEKVESTGFKPEISLNAGIAELIKGFQIIKSTQFRNA